MKGEERFEKDMESTALCSGHSINAFDDRSHGLSDVGASVFRTEKPT